MTEKTYLFEEMPIPRAMLKLAIPTVLSSLVMVFYNLADTYFVGMLNNSVQNAAVTLAAPVLLAFNAVNNLFGVGSSSMMSRALGRKDYRMVKESSAFGFYCSLFSGILFSFFCILGTDPLLSILGADELTYQATQQYLFWTVCLGAAPSILNVVLAYLVRSEGASLHASIGTMSGCFLNILLDPLFILPQGFNMGAAGAGLATFLSNCAACLYFFILIYAKRKDTYVCLSIKQLTFRREIVGGVCSVGIPAAIQNLLNVTGMTILNNFTSGFGAEAVAAMGITKKVDNVPFQVALGISQGIMPLVSYTYASGNRKRMKETILCALKIMVPALFVVSLVYSLKASFIIRLFMKNPVIVAYGTRFLKGMCLALPFLAIDFLAVGVFQALGRGRISLIFAILRKVILEIPALILLNYFFPLYGLVYAQPISELVLAAAAGGMLLKIFREDDPGKNSAGRQL